MPESAAPAPAESANPVTDWLSRHHFLLRRLHSLSGIVPIGLFVIMHLFTNAQLARSAGGHDHFQHEVDFIHDLPALLFLEIGLWGAIGFHAVLGVMYMIGIVPNVRQYKYMANWRYTLQRLTAWIALVFIFLHIATLRWRWNIGGWYTPFYWRGADYPDVEAALASTPMTTPLTAYALQYSWLVVVLYVVGVSSVIFHWCNGLWTAAITWGATVSRAAQKRWGYVCLALAAALTAFMAAAIIGALMYDLNEDTTPQQRQLLEKITQWEAVGK